MTEGEKEGKRGRKGGGEGGEKGGKGGGGEEERLARGGEEPTTASSHARHIPSTQDSHQGERKSNLRQLQRVQRQIIPIQQQHKRFPYGVFQCAIFQCGILMFHPSGLPHSHRLQCVPAPLVICFPTFLSLKFNKIK